MPSWTKPTPNQVARALAAIPRPEQARYFFAKLDNPEWLEPLEKQGSFNSPPEIERNESEGTIGFPLWAQGQYLVKIAANAPEAVFATIERVPETENFRVHEDFLATTTAMPAATAVRFVKRALGWWRKPHGWHLAEPLEKFLLHLARGGEVSAALKIAEALLECAPDPDAEKKARERRESWFRAELKPQMRTDWWRLRKLLRKGLPELARLAPKESIQMLASTLARFVEYSTWQPQTRRPVDLSHVWRPAIEQNRINWQHDVRGEVVAALRDTCEAALRSSSLTFDQIDPILKRQEWDIFERLRLHLYRLFPDLAGARIAAALTDRGLFERPDLTHERTLLLQAHFAQLEAEEQQTILGWIDEGPSLPDVSITGKPFDDDERLAFVKRLTLRQLQPIATSLPADWAKRYRALVTEFGEPSAGEATIRSVEWKSGSESPKSLEELRAMSLPDIIEFMRTWQPSTDFMAPNPTGLARCFEQLVAEQSAPFANQAGLMREVEPVYMYSLIRGLTAAVEKEQSMAWDPIIDLCTWIVAQIVDVAPKRAHDRGEDWHGTTWRPTRQEIGTLLGAGMKARPNAIPFTLRAKIWSILSTLCDDAEPTADEEATSGLDPLTLSINRVRGVALNQLADYGLWVRRNLEATNRTAGPPDLDDMPELRKRLELHLDPTREPTLMARATYGQSLPWLHLLDPEWTRAHLMAIFPRDENAVAFRRTAWISFICFTRAYDELLPVLQEEYRWAASNATEEEAGGYHGFGKPGEGLADHLLSFYWRGLLGFDHSDDLLVIFYTHASDSLRAHGMWAVGRGLEDSKTSPSREVVARWQRFWEWRLSIARNDPAVNRQELNAFTWWLISEKFDTDWALTQMTEVLSVVDSVEHPTIISEYLCKVSERKPFEAVSILRLLIEKTGSTRVWFAAPEEINSILRNAYACGQSAAATRAEELRDLLLSFGFYAAREVGPPSGRPNDSSMASS
jgi:hypothetical protein